MFGLMLLAVLLPVALSGKCRIYANFRNALGRTSATNGIGKFPLISYAKTGVSHGVEKDAG
ncbi:hypothetical protein [Alkaliphilus crotonatoxidans]